MHFLYVVAVVSVAAYANAHSTGAPESACIDMIPRHQVSAKESPAPYTITTSTKVVKAGTPMQVTISGKGPEDTIRGILLQARKGTEIVGTFTVDPNDDFAKTMNCGQPGNAVTHKTAKVDKKSVSFTWTPPAGFNDEIKFRATIVKTGATFWVGVESAPIKVIS